MATIKDIASRLGISTSTVSYALNGGPRQVPEPVKQKILDLARELNYRPNRVARSLVTGKTGVIGVIMPEPEQADWSTAHQMLTAILKQAPEELLVLTLNSSQPPEAFAFSLLDGRMDGCIALTSLHPTVTRMLDEQAFRMVAVGPMTGVSVDIEPGISDAVAHLREYGHSHFAFVGAPRAQQLHEIQRSIIYRATEGLIFSVVEATSGFVAGRKILNLDQKPTAILTCSDEFACGVAQALSAAGISAPKEYSIIGFGDCDWALAANPQLTTIRLPYMDMAAAAIALTKGESSARQFPTDLIIRESTGRPTRAAVSLRRFDRERFRGL